MTKPAHLMHVNPTLRSLFGLRLMWLLGILSPLYLYVVPFIYRWTVASVRCPPHHEVCVEWSHGGPDLRVLGLAVALAIVSLGVPVSWHRRSLLRLRRIRDAKGRLPRFSGAELTERAALERYAGRLAMVLAILQPIYFLAWYESHVFSYCRQATWGPERVFPAPENYITLLAIMTVFTALHFPTQERVLGAELASETRPRNDAGKR